MKVLFKIVNKAKKTYYKKYINTLIIGSEYLSNFQIIHPKKFFIEGNCYINALGGIKIGEYCHITKGIIKYSDNYNYNDIKMIPYDDSVIKNVVINDFVWICVNVMIEEGVIIKAGTVVTKNIPDYPLVGGNPATTLKYRDISLFKKLKKEGKFF